ncbi:TonB-dependent receptor [candidate division KSB1 bacterium]|nr:TonB-dependent receptor [candidate division KSB1 bacterium]
MQSLKYFILSTTLFLFFMVTQPAFAGITGKIAGTVMDVDNNTPLPGANIFVEGTTLGAASGLDGSYVILNVPPGTYTLKASMMGFGPMRTENVMVSIDLTTTIDFKMSSQVLEMGKEVVVVAERPMVTRDLTATTAVVSADEISVLPVTEISEAIELQAGLVKDAGGGIHIRGGRSGEVAYWVDGIPITDVYDGGAVVDLNKNMVQELQVVSGAFNAEYGQAMSGIVNIATKRGSNDFGGSITTYFGDNFSNHTKQFMHIDNINPVGIRNADGSLYGAIIKDKLFYYVNGRGIYFDGWLYGQRRFNPNTVTLEFERVSRDTLNKYGLDINNFTESRHVDNNYYDLLYILGSNETMDAAVYGVGGAELDSLRALHANSVGDNKYVPMNWNRKWYGQAKLIFKPTAEFSVDYSIIYDDVNYQEWGLDGERDYKYNPDGAPTKNRVGLTNIVKITHALSPRTYYSLGLSHFIKEFKRSVYEDMNDPRYIHPNVANLQLPYSYKTGGTDNKYFNRETETALVKLDLESQITNRHLVKTGVEFRKHRVYLRDITLRPSDNQVAFDFLYSSPYINTKVFPDSSIYASEYTHRPIELSAYIQDKMEFKNMIVNFGVRVDYFDPDGKVLNDESDPNIYDPIKPTNRYYDYGTDGLPNTYDSDGTEGNNLQDPGEPVVTLADREKYWFKDASSKLKISPRIGISFPITVRGVIHFSYGHFFQIPRFERLYQNPDFELESGTGNIGVIGNADLKPEQTINGEVGLQQQLTDDISLDITGYFRDIRDLAGTRAQEISLFGGFARYSKIINSDFGFIRGVILSLNKRFSGGLSATMDYTLQQAKGTNSDPLASQKALKAGKLPEVQLTSLDWDQRHTVNASVSYSARSWGCSLIGQYGSGLPYTPRAVQDISTLLTNSEWKPSSFNVDLRAYKDIPTAVGNINLFVRIFNLFDNLNQINVYDDTGKAGFTLDEAEARSSNPNELVNTIDDWFTNPTFYAEPRRIEVGCSLEF